MRDARTRGTPSLGSGAIYPISLDEIVIDPFPIPAYFKKCYGLDVGWNRTAAIWGALDPGDDVLYLYTEHYRGQASPIEHTSSIKARGDWIPGVIDPASIGSSQTDGKQLIIEYQELGLNVSMAQNAVEAGIYAVYDRLATGRLKVFKSCRNWQSEYNVYRRDVDGKIIKVDDHLMDGTRYLVVSGLILARQQPIVRPTQSIIGAGSLSKAGY